MFSREKAKYLFMSSDRPRKEETEDVGEVAAWWRKKS